VAIAPQMSASLVVLGALELTPRPASPVATIGATKATASATSISIPTPGMFLMSSGEKRISRNGSQIAAQIARQEIDAVRNDSLLRLAT
jgi:hypothetical protein